MDRSRLSHSLYLVLLVLAGTAGVWFIPQFSVLGYKFKRTDLFSDIRKAPGKAKSVAPMVMTPDDNKRISDTTDRGLIRFEDYSQDQNALENMLKALYLLPREPGKVKIALFGDSFIEGDIFCASLRDTLQDIFGGTGVGFVPITSQVAGFRNTVSHSFSGFTTYTIADRVREKVPYGAGGYCFIPGEGNQVTYKSHKSLRHLSIFKDLKIFYQTLTPGNLRFTFDDGTSSELPLPAGSGIQQLVFEDINCHTVNLWFPPVPDLFLYGVSFEDNCGLYVDNFGLRGNSGLGLSRIPLEYQHDFDSLQDYRLIILQYGLNVVDTNSTDLNWYIQSMSKVVNQVKAGNPGASILLMSVSDRSFRLNGEYVTMPGVPVMVNAQRKIAQKTGIAFWDLYSAMGGENSMVKFVNSKPSLANLDYTHVNYRGGRKLAHIFAETLLYELDRYSDETDRSRDTSHTVAVKH